MNQKLTLTVERKLIKRAKRYAKSEGRSLSSIVENYLKAITKEENEETDIEISPLVKSLKGSFKLPKDLDYKKELQDALTEKYLK